MYLIKPQTYLCNMKTTRILFLLLSICLLGACQPQATKVYNILDYGATGDGTTDDAPALQRAIDACSALPDILSCAAPSGWLLTLTSTSNPIHACWQTPTKASIPRVHLARTGAKA